MDFQTPTFDFYGSPVVPNQDSNKEPTQQQQQTLDMHQFAQRQAAQESMNNYQIPEPTPTVVVKGFDFPIKGQNSDSSKYTLKKIDDNEEVKPKRTRKKKEETPQPAGEMVPAVQGEITTNPTIYTYQGTTNMLGQTLDQIDAVTDNLKLQFDQVAASRTMKGKYNYLAELGDTLSKLLQAKAGVIKEINNAITKSNELDYRREKDRKEVESSQNDDKYVMDLYNAFIKNPMNNPNNQALLGPNLMQATLPVQGSGIVRADMDEHQVPAGQPADLGYLNYVSNLTPEQNTMFYENDPDVKTCVIFDAATGNKFFQVMNTRTGQAVPNVTTMDNRFLEDTTLDIKNKIAKNTNLNMTFPIIIINQEVADNY